MMWSPGRALSSSALKMITSRDCDIWSRTLGRPTSRVWCWKLVFATGTLRPPPAGSVGILEPGAGRCRSVGATSGSSCLRDVCSGGSCGARPKCKCGDPFSAAPCQQLRPTSGCSGVRGRRRRPDGPPDTSRAGDKSKVAPSGRKLAELLLAVVVVLLLLSTTTCCSHSSSSSSSEPWPTSFVKRTKRRRRACAGVGSATDLFIISSSSSISPPPCRLGPSPLQPPLRLATGYGQNN